MNQLSSTPSLAPRRPLRLAFIQAGWHADIVAQGRAGFVAELARHHVLPDAVDTFTVPGALEIPLLAQRLARGGQHQAVVCCALVVDGGIYRHEFVASAVIDGLMRVMLDEGVPVISAVLTPKNFHEHEEHRSYFSQHFVVKGAEAARACLAQVAVLHDAPALKAA
jgi:6,7-dimethyl-8-ribityllumazine synthase